MNKVKKMKLFEVPLELVRNVCEATKRNDAEMYPYKKMKERSGVDISLEEYLLIDAFTKEYLMEGCDLHMKEDTARDIEYRIKLVEITTSLVKETKSGNLKFEKSADSSSIVLYQTGNIRIDDFVKKNLQTIIKKNGIKW